MLWFKWLSSLDRSHLSSNHSHFYSLTEWTTWWLWVEFCLVGTVLMQFRVFKREWLSSELIWIIFCYEWGCCYLSCKNHLLWYLLRINILNESSSFPLFPFDNVLSRDSVVLIVFYRLLSYLIFTYPHCYHFHSVFSSSLKSEW